jgi:D-alanyl-D-alanine carboxypeptidase
MPVRLALAPQQEPVQLAAADPAPIADFAPPPPAADIVEVAANQPRPAIRSVELPMPTSAAKAAEAQTILADATPYRSAPAAGPTPVRAAAAEARALAAQVTAPRPRSFDAKKPSGWAVQLGAYDTAAVAKDKWSALSRSNPMLKSYPASSQSASVKSRGFYRLTVNGLATRAEAVQLCSALKARGQGCFVRSMNPGEKVQWASKPSVRLASR